LDQPTEELRLRDDIYPAALRVAGLEDERVALAT